MKRLIKKFLRIVLIAIIILLITVFIVPSIRNYVIKSKIINIVKVNEELLNSSIQSGAYKDVHEINGINDVTLWTTDSGNTYIDYFYKGFGIVPSSIYYGFYYHSIDKPIGFQGTNVYFERKGKGWYWSQPDGDNYCFTEKILDNWYYYEAGF